MLASFEDKARTFYVDVNRLPPASTITVGRSGVAIREYWTLEPEHEIHLGSDDEYAEAYRGHFVEAVRCRLRSALPLGSMLSGGLDSSSIACVANDLLSSNGHDALHTFSIVFDKVKKSDERRFIESVLAGRRFASHLIDGDSVTPFDDLDSVLWHQDEPFFAPNLSLTRSGWQAAREAGVRVLLDGVFGDNVVSHGTEHLRWLANRWRLLSLSRELRALNQKTEPRAPRWHSVGWFVLNFGLKPYLPEASLKAWRSLRGRSADPVAEQCAMFETGYRDRNGLPQRLRGSSRRDRVPRSSRQLHSESLGSGMIQTALEVYARGCSEFGLEARFPFLDKRLVEFCLAIPGEQKVNQGYTRAVVRRALRAYLPEAIRLRSGKANLGWSFKGGLRSRSDLIERTLESSTPFLVRYFDATRLRDLRERYGTGKLRDGELLDLFLAVILCAWHSRNGEVLAA
jgi:asparagine synthase (glutamine-hydrolysing)